MATLEFGDSGVTVSLSMEERVGAVHGSVSATWDQVATVRDVPDLWPEIKGIRAPGTGLPGVVMLGTTRYDGGKDFCAVYKHRPGVVIDLTGHEFARLLVTGERPELPAGQASKLAASPAPDA